MPEQRRWAQEILSRHSLGAPPHAAHAHSNPLGSTLHSPSLAPVEASTSPPTSSGVPRGDLGADLRSSPPSRYPLLSLQQEPPFQNTAGSASIPREVRQQSRPLPLPPPLSPTASTVQHVSQSGLSSEAPPLLSSIGASGWRDKKMSSESALPLSPATIIPASASLSPSPPTSPGHSTFLSASTCNSTEPPTSPLVADYKCAFLDNHSTASVPQRERHAVQAGRPLSLTGRGESAAGPSPDPLTEILRQFDDTHLDPPPAYSEAAPNTVQANCRDNSQAPVISRPSPIPDVRLDGGPRLVVAHCPEGSVRKYRLRWFRLRNVVATENFLMCSKCHADFIAGTHLDEHFKVVVREHGCCHFALPKLRLELLPETKRTGNVTPLLLWVERRASKRFCSPWADDSGIIWYSLKQPTIPDFWVCAECMDDIVSVTGYNDKFAITEIPPQGHLVCNLSDDQSREGLLRASNAGEQGWETYSSTLAKARRLPPCTGSSVPAASRKWFTTLRPIPRFVVCETCYLNQIKLTPFDGQFVPFTDPPGVGDQWSCDFVIPREQFAWVLASEYSNFDIWWSATDTVVKRSLALAGRPDLEMYGLANNPRLSSWGEGCDSDFSLCGLCYACFVTPLRLEAFFRPRAIGTGHQCSLCISPVRYATYIDHFVQALDTGLWTPFYECAFWLGHAAPCPGNVTIDGRRWWGWRNILQVCEECWWTFAKDTWAAAEMQLHGETLVRNNLCSLHSPRMRDMWTKACRLKSTTALLSFATERYRIYTIAYQRAGYLRQQSLPPFSSSLLSPTSQMSPVSPPSDSPYGRLGQSNQSSPTLQSSVTLSPQPLLAGCPETTSNWSELSALEAQWAQWE